MLPVKDETEKVELARKAVQEDLSSRDLAAEVKRLKESQRDGAKLGRPSLPAFVKAFGHLRKIRDQAATDAINADSFTNFSPEKARIFLDDVEHWLDGIQAIVDEAREALDGCSAPAATEELRDADEREE